ncbi:hypothetical protein JCM9279_000856 [Rhodotorula babjevae]
MDPSHRPACLSCAQRRPGQLDCDGGYPCSACHASATRCTYPRPSTPPSAWTNTAAAAVQRWPESVQLVPGKAATFRLRAERNKDGQVEAFRREWVVNQDQDLRLRPRRRGKTSLLFPASVDDRDEAEALDLDGDPLDFAREGQILLNLHDVLRHDPLQPTVGLNAAIHDRQSSSSSQTRILRTFEPRDPNVGNVLAACDVALDDGASTSSTCVAFRRAEKPGGRPTAIGWGSFAPLPRELRAPSRKGKGKERERDGDAASGFRASTEPLFTSAYPVRQVELSRLGSNSSALLGVRTQGSLDLLHLSLPPPSTSDPALPPPPPTTLSRFTYTASSLSRRPIADFALSPTLGAGLVVDTDGGLFGWGLGARGSGRVGDRDWRGAQPEMFRLRGGRKKGEGGYSGMARVQCGGVRGTDAVVAVEDEVLLYDLRSPRASVQLVDPHLLSQHLAHGETDPARIVSLLRRSPSVFDSPIAPPTTTAQHVVATTHDVLYLDERMPSRALLRWKHGRCGLESKGVDLTLSLLEVPPHACDSAQRDSAEPVLGRAALTSRLHPHVELYTTRADPAHAPQFALGPYALEGPRVRTASASAAARPERFTRAGTAFVPLPPRAAAPSPAADAMDIDGASRSSSDEDEGGPAARRERLAETRRAARSRSWRLLEAGARGELSVREVELERFAEPGVEEGRRGSEGEGEEEVGGADGSVHAGLSAELVQLGAEAERARSRRSSRERRRQKEDERLIDVSGVRRVLAPERVLKADRAADEDGEGVDPAQTAVQLVRGATAREEGDVGALTGLELLSLSSRHSTIINDDDDVALEPLPRPTAYDHLSSIPSESTAALDAALAAAPAALRLRPAHPPTHFSTLLPRRLPPFAAAPAASATERLRALAAERVERHHALASHILLPRAIEPDEPVRAPNQPQPADEDPPSLHFSYLRPKAPTSADIDGPGGDGDVPGPRKVGRGARRKVKGVDLDPPSLDSLGARLLLADWHVGADPRSYTWFSPYDDDQDKDLDALAVSQAQASSSSRRKKREREAAKVGPTSSAMSWQPSFPPSSASYGASSQSYFPSLGPPQVGSNASLAQSQSQDWPQLAATQPTISVSGPVDPSASSQGPPGFGGAASQTVPGAFGSRLGVGVGRGGAGEKDKKKKGKKRVSGF